MTGKRRIRGAAALVAVAAFSFALGGQVSGLAGSGDPNVVVVTKPILGGNLAAYDPPGKFPKAGVDAFESIAEIELQVPCGGTSYSGAAAGPTVVQRSAVGDGDGDGRREIDTEIIQMSLTGYIPDVGPVEIRENATQASTGFVEQSKAGAAQDFPAASFFDVFIELDSSALPWGTLHNETPIRMTNGKILGIPPIGSEYRGNQTIPLVDAGSAQRACIVDVAHVPEDPSHVMIKRENFTIEKKLDQILLLLQP